MLVEDDVANGGRAKLAVRTNFCLFVVRLYAAIRTSSLSLFATTTTDAFNGPGLVGCDAHHVARVVPCQIQ